jgi:phosphotransacetylase
VVSYSSLQASKEHYEEPLSLNDHMGELGEEEDIPLSEKNRLHQRLKQLTQQELAQVVFIVQESCTEGFKELGGGRAQLHLDSIDAEAFKRINAKIDEFLEGEKATGSKKLKV